MGSAFACEPLGVWLATQGGVLLRVADTADDGLVIHMTHPDCTNDTPHRMSECGMFAHQPTEADR